MGANMPPSILAEVSFISNPEEEQLLSSGSYRTLIAHSIASGIKAYFSSSTSVQKVAGARQDMNEKLKAFSGPAKADSIVPQGFLAER